MHDIDRVYSVYPVVFVRRDRAALRSDVHEERVELRFHVRRDEETMVTFAHFMCLRACVFLLTFSLSQTLSLSRSQNDAVVVTTVVPLVLPPSSSSSKSLFKKKWCVDSFVRNVSSFFFLLLSLYVLGF